MRLVIRFSALVLLLAVPASASGNPWKKLWVVSTVALAAGTAMDFSSSVGKAEMNPALRSSTGQFSAGRAIALKGGIAVGLIVTQRFYARRHPGVPVEKTAAITNFVSAGVMTGVAFRNRGIR